MRCTSSNSGAIMSYKQNIKSTNKKKLLHHTQPYRDNRKSAYGLTVGDIVSGDFWYDEQLTWEVTGFDDELIKLRCFEFDIPTQTAHHSKLVRVSTIKNGSFALPTTLR